MIIFYLFAHSLTEWPIINTMYDYYYFHFYCLTNYNNKIYSFDARVYYYYYETHTHISLNKRYQWQFFLLLLLQMSCHAVMKWIHNELNEQCNGFGCVFMGIEEIFHGPSLLDSLWRNYKDQIGAFVGENQNYLKKLKFKILNVH